MVFSDSDQPHPLSEAVTVLQSIYGAPSQAGFGSAVFYDQIEPESDLETVALRVYQHFVGPLWEQYGETAWMSTWKQVYVRPNGIQPNTVAELRAIADPLTAQYIPILLLSETEERDRAEQALANVFDAPQMTDLRLYAIGDGAAMSGLLLVGCHITGDTTVLISLVD